MLHNNDKQSGFTLIEILITMVVALVVLAGMSSLFVSQTRTANTLNQKSEALNDLFLASQIMQQELRGAQAICWKSISGTRKVLRYQPLGATVKLDAACKKEKKDGAIELRPTNFNDGGIPTPHICWRRPDTVRCEEMIREMKAQTGITMTPSDNSDLQAVRTITLTSEYKDRENVVRPLSLSFKVWPRNTQ